MKFRTKDPFKMKYGHAKKKYTSHGKMGTPKAIGT